jgi:hypothetical protein
MQWREKKRREVEKRRGAAPEPGSRPAIKKRLSSIHQNSAKSSQEYGKLTLDKSSETISMMLD